SLGDMGSGRESVGGALASALNDVAEVVLTLPTNWPTGPERSPPASRPPGQQPVRRQRVPSPTGSRGGPHPAPADLAPGRLNPWRATTGQTASTRSPRVAYRRS